MIETLSNASLEPPQGRPRRTAHLFRILSAHALGDAPARHVLVDLDVVEIGRGEPAGHRRQDRRLRIDLVDGWASSAHAQLTSSVGGWFVNDVGSKNGTLVNGVRIAAPTQLGAGDLLEIGRSYFWFAPGIDWTPTAPVDAGAVEPLPGVATLVPALAAALTQVAAIARGLTPVLIGGATGTGKEVVARGVHAASGRPGPFVPVNCGAIPRDLVESTLFGHRRGAFSGAVDDEPGLVRTSDRGTLFLDEIGDLPLPAQATLLRVLQEREVMGVGASRATPVDLRCVSASHRDLTAMVAAGSFRADLLHRLRGFAVELPPLSERLADLGLLIATLVGRLAPGRTLALHPRAVRALLAHAWPGNIRELELVLGAALQLADAELLGPEHLPAELVDDEPARSLDAGERDRLVALLTEHRGNVRAIARAVGKDPVQVRRWLRRHALDPAGYR